MYLLRLGLFVGAMLGVAYGAIAVYAALLFSRVERVPVTRSPGDIAPGHEDVTLVTIDGLRLSGWYFPGGERAVVLVHVKDGNRDSATLAFVGRTLHAAGYALLAIDMRGHGGSEGERFSLGHHERKDVAAAVDLLVERGHPPSRIALYGESMGAGTVIQTLRLRPGIAAVVADSAYADGPTIIDEAGPSSTGLPPIFTPGITLAARVLLGIDADAVDPERVVRDNPARPFLFIHCEDDTLIRVSHARRLRAASAHRGSDLWVVPGCGHVGASTAWPDEYARRLLAFLDASLGDR